MNWVNKRFSHAATRSLLPIGARVRTLSVGSGRPQGRSADSLGHKLSFVILFVGFLATAVGSYAAVSAHGVYWSRVQVRFIAPTSKANPNTLQLSPSAIVMTAAAVGREVDPSPEPRTSSPDVTLVGRGARQGWSVTLPNTGGQWAANFTNPYLDVQAVGETSAAVQAQMQQLVAKINSTLASLQAQAGVDQHNLIKTQLSPISGPPIFYQRGSRVRAGLAALGLGISLTVVARAQAVRLLRRRGMLPVALLPLAPPLATLNV